MTVDSLHPPLAIGSAPFAASALAVGTDWRAAIDDAATQLGRTEPDLLLLYASYHHAEQLSAVVREARDRLRPGMLAGATGVGVAAGALETERTPAIALLGLWLPGARLHAVHVAQTELEAGTATELWWRHLAADVVDPAAWVLLGDPFHLDIEQLVGKLAAAFPAAPIVGGLTSPGPHDRRTWLMLDDEIVSEGALAVAIMGDYDVVPMVSQGTEPIGETWAVTQAQAHWIETIGNRPAVDVLVETLAATPEDARAGVRHNLLLGLAADEYRHEFARGDFLVRNIVGVDQTSGAIAAGAMPRVGQTLQFHVRDAAIADLDLAAGLETVRVRLNGRTPVAGLLWASSDRGTSLFGTAHHDAQAIARKLGAIPLLGLFCAGEIGPVGGVASLHGHTVSLALIVPRG